MDGVSGQQKLHEYAEAGAVNWAMTYVSLHHTWRADGHSERRQLCAFSEACLDKSFTYRVV